MQNCIPSAVGAVSSVVPACYSVANINKLSFSIHAQTVESFYMQHKLKIAINGDGKTLSPFTGNMLKITWLQQQVTLFLPNKPAYLILHYL